MSTGTHSIVAVYKGDDSFAESASSALTLDVQRDAGGAVLGSSSNPSRFRQPVTLTTIVTPAVVGGRLPTGSVTFDDGGTALGTAVLDGDGRASFQTSTLEAGDHALSASYSGDANHAPSRASLTQTVQAAETSTSLSSLQHSVDLGAPLVLEASVQVMAPGTGAPDGVVVFKDGATRLGSVALNQQGTAAFTTTNLQIGSHTITASFEASVRFMGSSSMPVGVTVTPIPTTTTLLDSVNPSVYGQPTVLAAQVATTAQDTSTPSGSLTFLDGSVVLTSAVPLDGRAQASYTTLLLTPGEHLLTVRYSGDATHAASTSQTLTHVVNQDLGGVALGTSSNPAVFGQLVTFTAMATASPPGTGVPTGSITFKDGATTLAAGVPLNASGQATYSTSSLAVGSHSVVAEYSGDANFAAASSTVLAETVNRAPTTSSVTSTLNPSNSLDSVTLTATVAAATPSSATPTGTVTFMDGSNVLESNVTLDNQGTATFTTAGLKRGTHAVTAVYSGGISFGASTSPQFTQTVNPALFMTILGNKIVRVTMTGTPGTYVSLPLGTSGYGLAVDAGGDLFVSQHTGSGNESIFKVLPDRTMSTLASGFSVPNGLVYNSSGTLYVVDQGNGTVLTVSPAGTVTQLAGGLGQPVGVAMNSSGDLFVSDRNTNTIFKVTSAGVVTTFATGFSTPLYLTFDTSDNLYVANFGNDTVSRVTPSGTITTYASGFGGTPVGLAFDESGNLYVGSHAQALYKVGPGGGTGTLLSTGFGDPLSIVFY